MALVSTTFTTEPRQVLQSYRSCHRGAYALRCGLTAVMVVLGLASRDVVILGLGAVYFVGSELWVRRQLRPYLGGPRRVTVTMTEEEYRTEGEGRATARTWSNFQSVRRVGGFWVLRVSNAAALSLPADALDDDQAAAFRELVARKGLLQD